jgi:putative DNA primase/helicase
MNDRFTDANDLGSEEKVRAGVNGAEEVQESDEEAYERLAKMSPADYDRNRKREAEKLGIRIETLDKEVTRTRGEESKSGQGKPFEFESLEPWHKKVTTSSLLNELSATFARYLILPPHGATALSLWTMHTYLMDEFSSDPYLGFTSPEKRCGKSRALTLLSLTCHRSVLGGNITPSALYRVIDAYAPTLLIDELDTGVSKS